MQVSLTIQNYRCFIRPTTLPISKGFTGFVGMNNAGKSALMRFLLEFRNAFHALAHDENQFSLAVSGAQAFGLNQVLDPQEVFSNRGVGNIQFSLEFEPEVGDSFSDEAVKRARFYLDRSMRLQLRLESFGGTTLGEKPIQRHAPHVYSASGTHQVVNASHLVLVLSKLANTLYIGPFRNTVSVGTNTDYIDIQIGEAFISRFREYKSGNVKKYNDDILRLTNDIARIFEFDSLSIDATPDGRSLHIAVNGRSYKQHEMGAGLAQFILVLANASTRNPAFILIDEPELGLHPKLQLDFLTTLGTYCTEGVWFSTHSLGLARSVTSEVYSVRRMSDGDSLVTLYNAIPRLAEFLGEMSFAAHQEIGFERILLVEGPTDVTTFQQVLRKYGLEHKVLLLSLSGRIVGDMTEELQEILRITNKVSAIIDSERREVDAPISRQRLEFVEQCGSLNIPCCVLQRRATENYFSDRAIKSVLGHEYAALGPYQSMAELPKRWSKAQNWQLANAMTKEEFLETDLGTFLSGL